MCDMGVAGIYISRSWGDESKNDGMYACHWLGEDRCNFPILFRRQEEGG